MSLPRRQLPFEQFYCHAVRWSTVPGRNQLSGEKNSIRYCPPGIWKPASAASPRYLAAFESMTLPTDTAGLSGDLPRAPSGRARSVFGGSFGIALE